MHKFDLKRRLLATREEAAQIYYVDKAIDELADQWDRQRTSAANHLHH